MIQRRERERERLKHIFNLKKLDEDTVSLMKKRVYDITACTGKTVSVYLNGKKLDCKTLDKYAKYYFDDYIEKVYEKSREDNFKTFRDWLNIVWNYAGTWSLENYDTYAIYATHATHAKHDTCATYAPLPHMPHVLHVPDMPDMPHMPHMPHMPYMPHMPHMPHMPRMPHMPHMPLCLISHTCHTCHASQTGVS